MKSKLDRELDNYEFWIPHSLCIHANDESYDIVRKGDKWFCLECGQLVLSRNKKYKGV